MDTMQKVIAMCVVGIGVFLAWYIPIYIQTVNDVKQQMSKPIQLDNCKASGTLIYEIHCLNDRIDRLENRISELEHK